MKFARAIFCIVVVCAFVGCTNEQPAAPSPRAQNIQPLLEPVGQQLAARVPPLRSQRFSIVMDFETDSDGVFIGSRPQGHLVYDRFNTGRRSARFEAGSTRVIIKFGSLLSGRAFPDDWTLLGAFVYCEQPIEVSMTVRGTGYEIPSRAVSIAGNSWTCAVLDLTSSEKAKPLPDDARFVISLPAHHPPVWIDDVVLINNTEVLVGADRAVAPIAASEPTTSPTTESTTEPTTAPTNSPTNSPTNTIATTQPSPDDVRAAWVLEHRGLSYIGSAPGKFNFKLLSSEASKSGWKLEEANALRARFSSEGSERRLTVYADGRSYWDGAFKPMSSDARDNPAYADQHTSPGEVQIAPEQGRVNRDTPGDANNDGYNEERGAYQVIASGARLELKFTPHTAVVASPVLEITGMPAGAVLTTVEGRLIENSLRLSDGTLLVELPVKIDRATTINIRLRE